jgi:hypothetical protein
VVTLREYLQGDVTTPEGADEIGQDEILCEWCLDSHNCAAVATEERGKLDLCDDCAESWDYEQQDWMH